MQQSDEKVYINLGNADVTDLVPPGAGRILDLGCGAGDNARILISKGYRVTGVTISANEASIAEEFMEKVFVHNLELGLPENLDGLFDYVLLSHVLEHICYPSKLLADIKRVMHPGGKVIVALPNIMHYSARIKLMAGKFNYENSGLWDNTHFRWYTFETGQQLLDDHGFHLQYADVSGGIPFGRIVNNLFGERFRKVLFNVLKRISRGFFGYQILLVATPKNDKSG
jgi:methionine biosynthesis protein MetW